MSDRQCSSCGGFCGRGGCKRENVKVNKQREALQVALEALEKYGTPRLNNEDAYSAAIKTIREALAEPEPALQWQPINSAPKDRDMLTYGRLPGSYGYYDEEWCYSISKWAGNGWSSQRSMAYGSAFIPTHWMPLPERPQGEV